ncbi:GCN5 family N-acetyltransferase [Actinoplanes philippinensis]|uniref:N-acetylglutamate synthase, GNAT family n=1 Tax=Actinoplanes philippinensis TaxID=35752 RepID=A0A1I2M640_9ACTN|nr:GNAT family N-acetyltransferase [Actinoplanes philippinensis]GIE83042.1 GCN5 family N-acetyltransferase [Actinoplanes philippinensis]SFF86289.1 N-acetylglutamate synthase, GNAT family [Actinoplanes philippinensis]
MRIREARLGELPALQEIERAAGVLFREVGMPEIADDEPFSIEVLSGYVTAGRAWVAEERVPADGVLLGYLIADMVDGNVHIEQVSVDPQFSRRGIGRLLLDRAANYAVEVGAPALTLTTFADVAWNAPYYGRCGFEVMDDAVIMPELRAVREHEGALGLDRWPRVCMRRWVDATSFG